MFDVGLKQNLKSMASLDSCKKAEFERLNSAAFKELEAKNLLSEELYAKVEEIRKNNQQVASMNKDLAEFTYPRSGSNSQGRRKTLRLQPLGDLNSKGDINLEVLRRLGLQNPTGKVKRRKKVKLSSKKMSGLVNTSRDSSRSSSSLRSAQSKSKESTKSEGRSKSKGTKKTSVKKASSKKGSSSRSLSKSVGKKKSVRKNDSAAKSPKGKTGTKSGSASMDKSLLKENIEGEVKAHVSSAVKPKKKKKTKKRTSKAKNNKSKSRSKSSSKKKSNKKGKKSSSKKKTADASLSPQKKSILKKTNISITDFTSNSSVKEARPSTAEKGVKFQDVSIMQKSTEGFKLSRVDEDDTDIKRSPSRRRVAKRDLSKFDEMEKNVMKDISETLTNREKDKLIEKRLTEIAEMRKEYTMPGKQLVIKNTSVSSVE